LFNGYILELRVYLVRECNARQALGCFPFLLETSLPKRNFLFTGIYACGFFSFRKITNIITLFSSDFLFPVLPELIIKELFSLCQYFGKCSSLFFLHPVLFPQK